MKKELLNFIASLEAKELNDQQVSLLFQGEEFGMGSGNGNGSCGGGLNHKCSNDYCDNSTNTLGCSNTLYCENSNNHVGCTGGGTGGTGGTGGGSGANRMTMMGFPGLDL